MKKLLFTSIGTVLAAHIWGAGFGIYEASSRGNAMGGAIFADTTHTDATMNYYNPANIAFATNIQVAAGVTFINPYCDVTVDRRSQDRMNPGWFTVPTFYATIPLPYDFTFGYGSYTEFGLGSKYANNWDLASDTQKTTLEQFTFNPNLAYKITPSWSVAGGARISWIRFQNRKAPHRGETYYPFYPNTTYGIPNAYHLTSKLKGDDVGAGWMAATSYQITDDISVGLIYRSKIKHKIKGRMNLNGDVAGYPQPAYGRASAKLTLPRSITGGVNWNVTKKYRVGLGITWTEWSSVRNIDFKLPTGTQRLPLHWQDVWRFSIGMEYDLYDWMSLRIGYNYDRDPSSKHHGTTMIPAGDRHIIGTGVGFEIYENLWLDMGYSFIRMNNDDRFITTTDGQSRRFATHNGSSHLVSATIRYSF